MSLERRKESKNKEKQNQESKTGENTKCESGQHTNSVNMQQGMLLNAVRTQRV